MRLRFAGEIYFWRGPAPWYFVAVPANECAALAEAARSVSYGWGVIPVRVRIGDTDYDTSLFPKDGGYAVPVKAAVRRAEDVDEGDTVTLSLTLDL